MRQHIAHLALLVRDYEEALDFYTKKLNFQIVEDNQLTPTKRWLLIAPKGAIECGLLLAKATTPEQEKSIGYQAGGRVLLYLFTDDFWRDYEQMKANGIQFVDQAPREEPFGTVIVFEDLYGNQWDLIERK